MGEFVADEEHFGALKSLDCARVRRDLRIGSLTVGAQVLQQRLNEALGGVQVVQDASKIDDWSLFFLLLSGCSCGATLRLLGASSRSLVARIDRFAFVCIARAHQGLAMGGRLGAIGHCCRVCVSSVAAGTRV